MEIAIHDPSWGELICGAHMYVGKMGEVLAALGHDVTFLINGDRFPEAKLAEAYGLDFSRIRFQAVPAESQGRGRLASYLGGSSDHRGLSDPYDLFVYNTSGEVPPISHAARAVVMVNFPCISYEDYHGYSTAEWGRRPAAVRALRRRYHAWKWNRVFSSYPRVIANSQYTRVWVRRCWKADPMLVYPPARIGRPSSDTKRPLILGLGRFMPDKKHGVLIETFKRMCDRGLKDWRLVLVGSSSQLGGADPYLLTLKDSTQGDPIDILTDLPGHEVDRLLKEATLFWHTKGFGEDPEKNPQEFEHYGIATVEAMAAGCVPLVFRGGGQIEIIRHGTDGLLWESTDELIEHTENLICSERRREELARSALERAQGFSGEAFEARIMETITPLLARESSS